MYFGFVNCPVLEAHRCNTFQLPPATFAILFAQPGKISDGAPNSDWFDFRDPPDNLKLHRIFIKVTGHTTIFNSSTRRLMSAGDIVRYFGGIISREVASSTATNV